MAAKTWDADFRRAAIEASLQHVGPQTPEDLFETPGSFCLPVAEKPIVGWTPGRFMLIAIVLGFALLGGGVLLVTKAEKGPAGPTRNVLTAVAVCCSLSGIVMFFLPLKLDGMIMRWLIGDRARSLKDRADRTRLLVAEVANADRSSMKISIDGDDYALIFPDDINRRLLIEGIGARYQIRADDVEKLQPFEFINYLGVEIVYRIGDTGRLRLAIARPSLLLEVIRQVPILFFLRKSIPNKLLKRISGVMNAVEKSPEGVQWV